MQRCFRSTDSEGLLNVVFVGSLLITRPVTVTGLERGCSNRFELRAEASAWCSGADNAIRTADTQLVDWVRRFV